MEHNNKVNIITKPKISDRGIMLILATILTVFFLSIKIPEFLLILTVGLLMLSPAFLSAVGIKLIKEWEIRTIWPQWEVNEEWLHIKGITDAAGLKASSLDIGLVALNSQWQPQEKSESANEMKYSRQPQDCSILKNNKKAFVLYKSGCNQYLVILSGDTYYLVGHALVADLYAELFGLGARAKVF